jgi:uncharacterized peroxidase-related enzyme
MPYIEIIEPDSASGKLAETYSEIVRNRGHLSNIWKLASLEPDILESHIEMNVATMRKPGGLSGLEREVIAVTVAAANECPYCLHHHAQALQRAGGSKDLIDALISGEEPDTESKRIRRLIYFARKLTLLPNSMTRRDADDLRLAGLGDYEILQTVQVAAYYNYTTRFAAALGAELEKEDE